MPVIKADCLFPEKLSGSHIFTGWQLIKCVIGEIIVYHTCLGLLYYAKEKDRAKRALIESNEFNSRSTQYDFVCLIIKCVYFLIITRHIHIQL